eukprot:6469759-Amphidinium_carterae.1
MHKHFKKVGIHEGTPEEINTQQLRTALNINELGSSSTPDEAKKSMRAKNSREQGNWSTRIPSECSGAMHP